MKYCPYCGVSLSGGAASFCPECGKALRAKGHTAHNVRQRPPHQKKRNVPAKSQRPKSPMDENYDGYYNDVQPVDVNREKERHDPELVKRIVCVIAGTVGIIVLAVILMTVL